MTDQQHPITPPPELVKQWRNSWHSAHGEFGVYIATQAARWGADQELEACCEWLPSDLTIDGESLRDARRPKPPSLAEEAMEAADALEGFKGVDTIRRALERLQELEDAQ